MKQEHVQYLINELARPLFNWRMAHNNTNSSNPSMRKSSATRQANAEQQIVAIVERYASK